MIQNINKNDYKIEEDTIIYNPPVGITIKQAIINAIEIAKNNKKSVELHINDVSLEVSQSSNVSNIALKYFIKLERKYNHINFYNKNISR